MFLSFPVSYWNSGLPVLGGLSAWLDASKTSSITSSGGSVSQWNDLSGLGNNALQATAGQQPTTGEKTINSKNTISFHGNASNQWMKILNMSTNCQTVFAVWRHNTSTYTDWDGIIVARTSGSTKTPDSTNASGLTGDLAATTSVCNVGQVTTSVALDGIAKTPGDFDNFNIGINTSPITNAHVLMLQSSGNSSGTQNYGIGADTFGAVGARHLDGDIAEIIVYNRVLAASEIASVTSYLKNKWSI